MFEGRKERITPSITNQLFQPWLCPWERHITWLPLPLRGYISQVVTGRLRKLKRSRCCRLVEVPWQ